MNEHDENAGKALAGAGFGTVLDAARTACAHAYAAWVEAPLPRNITDIPQGALVAPVHQGRACGLADVSRVRPLVDSLARAGVLDVVADSVRPGRWQLTSYKGILAARDTPAAGEDSKVYVGEDSLHFVDWIASAPHGASALDIGAGSGISSIALARRAGSVTAVDIDADCCRAIPFTARLNGAQAQVETVQADVTAGLDLGRRFDLVVGNTPGVPIPRHIRYSLAGDGGADGLRVSRSVLEQLPQLLSANATVMLKFESAGDDVYPKSQQLLKNLAEQHGWSALFVQHSRIPMEVRSAISTRWAAPLNAGMGIPSLLREFDRHAQDIGATQFYTCSVQITARGDGRLTNVPVYGYGDWAAARDVRPLLKGLRADVGEALTRAYLERMRTLPDGLWELDVQKYLFLPLQRAADVLSAQHESTTFGDGVRAAFARELEQDPVHARSLYVLVAILMDACAAAR